MSGRGGGKKAAWFLRVSCQLPHPHHLASSRVQSREAAHPLPETMSCCYSIKTSSSPQQESNTKCLALFGVRVRARFQALLCKQVGQKCRADEWELMPSHSGHGDWAATAGMLPVSCGGSRNFRQYIFHQCPDPSHFVWMFWVWMTPAQKSGMVKHLSCTDVLQAGIEWEKCGLTSAFVTPTQVLTRLWVCFYIEICLCSQWKLKRRGLGFQVFRPTLPYCVLFLNTAWSTLPDYCHLLILCC